jgi:hypothetical protein
LPNGPLRLFFSWSIGPLAQLRSAMPVTLAGFFVGQKKAAQDRAMSMADDNDGPAEASSWALELQPTGEWDYEIIGGGLGRMASCLCI